MTHKLSSIQTILPVKKGLEKKIENKQDLMIDVDVEKFLCSNNVIFDMEGNISANALFLAFEDNDDDQDIDILFTTYNGDILLNAYTMEEEDNIKSFYTDIDQSTGVLNMKIYTDKEIVCVLPDDINLRDMNLRRIENAHFVFNEQGTKSVSYTRDKLFAYSPISLIKNTSFDFDDVYNADYMFYNCKELVLENVQLPEKISSMRNMFCGCSNIKVIPKLNGFTNSGTVSFENTFSGCLNLERIEQINISQMPANGSYNTFYRCEKLNYINVVSTDAERIKVLASLLPTHTDGGIYTLDLSDNTPEVLEAFGDYTVMSWTVIKSK